MLSTTLVIISCRVFLALSIQEHIELVQSHNRLSSSSFAVFELLVVAFALPLMALATVLEAGFVGLAIGFFAGLAAVAFVAFFGADVLVALVVLALIFEAPLAAEFLDLVALVVAFVICFLRFCLLKNDFP